MIKLIVSLKIEYETRIIDLYKNWVSGKLVREAKNQI